MRLAFVALYGMFDHSRTALTGSALAVVPPASAFLARRVPMPNELHHNLGGHRNFVGTVESPEIIDQN